MIVNINCCRNNSVHMTEYAYDTMDHVTNISWRTLGGESLGGFAYEYDAVGRIVSRSHAINGQAQHKSYTYDDLDRLSSDGGVSYTYDAAGNRTTKTENGETITYTLGLSDGLASWMSMGSPWMLHLYVVNQSPIVRGCKCFWRPVTSIDGDVPPRGAAPMNGSPAGGGVTFK